MGTLQGEKIVLVAVNREKLQKNSTHDIYLSTVAQNIYLRFEISVNVSGNKKMSLILDRVKYSASSNNIIQFIVCVTHYKSIFINISKPLILAMKS